MPYSDNMYSMNDDSDGDDYASRLSPSDGQFPASSSNLTPYVPNIFIPDPTLRQQQQEQQQKTGKDAGSKGKEVDEYRPSPRPSTEFGYHPSESSLSRPSVQLGQATTSTFASLSHHSRDATYSLSSASQASPGVFPSRAWTPSIYSEAPPAYSPSPVSPIASGNIASQPDRPRNYDTFGTSRTMGAALEVEGERLLVSHPESMGAPVDDPSGTPAWARRARRRLPAWLSWKSGLLVLVVLILSVASLSGIISFSSPSSHPHNNGDGITPGPALPVDKDPAVQVPGGPGSSGSIFQPPLCRGEQHRYDDQVLSLDFEKSQNLTFKQTIYKNRGPRSLQVEGRIDVRRLNESDGEPRMVLEIVTNDPGLRLYTVLDEDTQEMRINVPNSVESTVPGQRPCVEMKATVWVPEDGDIGILSLHAVHLDILLLDDLSLHVAGYTDLSSVVGDITAAAHDLASSHANTLDAPPLSDPPLAFAPARDSWALDSRVIEVHTTSGAINGNWPLYDMLGLHTTSGVIHVDITPEAADPKRPKPAVLSISTVSGSVTAMEPLSHSIQRRDYLVDVRSTSGVVRGALAFGAAATVRTTAGNIDLDLLPVVAVAALSPQKPALLETISTSGSISVRVAEPVFFSGEDDGSKEEATSTASSSSGLLDHLTSTHKSTSGSIVLKYPQSWEGLLRAETTTGRLNARGKDLKILRYEGGGWTGSKMEARKGAPGEKSTIDVHALLGGMDALIGDER